MEFNIYYFIFYVLYKFSWLADKNESKPEIIAQSAFLSLSACVFLMILSIAQLLNIGTSLRFNRLFDFLFWGLILFFVYYINGRIFIRNKQYFEIAKRYEGKIKLNNLTIITIALFILLGSLITFLIVMKVTS